MSFAGAAEIERSLEIAAARGGDLSNAVYARLFLAFPETEKLFVLDRDGQVRGAMLAHVFESLLDFIGERRFAHRFVGAEIVTHEGFGVARDAFADFFEIVRDEVREACGPSWNAAIEDAWRRLLFELRASVSEPAA